MLAHKIKIDSDADLYTKALGVAAKELKAMTGEDMETSMAKARQIANWMFRNGSDFKAAADRLKSARSTKAIADKVKSRTKVGTKKVAKKAVPAAQAAA